MSGESPYEWLSIGGDYDELCESAVAEVFAQLLLALQ